METLTVTRRALDDLMREYKERAWTRTSAPDRIDLPPRGVVRVVATGGPGEDWTEIDRGGAIVKRFVADLPWQASQIATAAMSAAGERGIAAEATMGLLEKDVPGTLRVDVSIEMAPGRAKEAWDVAWGTDAAAIVIMKTGRSDD